MTLGLVVGLCIEGDIIALFEPDPGADLVETGQGQNIDGVAAERRQLVPVPDPATFISARSCWEIDGPGLAGTIPATLA